MFFFSKHKKTLLENISEIQSSEMEVMTGQMTKKKLNTLGLVVDLIFCLYVCMYMYVHVNYHLQSGTSLCHELLTYALIHFRSFMVLFTVQCYDISHFLWF